MKLEEHERFWKYTIQLSEREVGLFCIIHKPDDAGAVCYQVYMSLHHVAVLLLQGVLGFHECTREGLDRLAKAKISSALDNFRQQIIGNMEKGIEVAE